MIARLENIEQQSRAILEAVFWLERSLTERFEGPAQPRYVQCQGSPLTSLTKPKRRPLAASHRYADDE